MAGEPIEEWRNPSPYSSDAGDSSSDDSLTSYEEEEPTPRIKKKARTEEDDDPDYAPTEDRPATRGSGTPQRSQADEEDRVSKLLIHNVSI